MAFNDPRNISKIFIRDLFFKDESNRPISTNRVLAARGDGGTYWADTSISTQNAFNAFRAGSNIYFTASNASNTLWFEPGAGIEFFSTLDGDQPKVWIAGTSPAQLTVLGGSTLVFSNLPDDLSGGRTLTFGALGGMTISISDNTVFFDSSEASTLSSIANLQSTTIYLLDEASTIANEVSTLSGVVDILLVSTSISSFYSTLLAVKENAEEVSTFVHSTFSISSGTMYVTYPNVYISSLTVNELKGVNLPSGGGVSTLLSTFSTIYWSTAFGLDTNTSTLRVSTIMGTDLPIITFDMPNRRLGVNLGATQQPRTTVDVSGIVFANNFLTASDRRLKKDLAPLKSDAILSAYKFTWTRDGKADVGFMADEVEAVAPECVFTDDRGYKGVDYARLVPYCFSAMAALAARVSTLESSCAKDPKCTVRCTA
jgi:hypothetical protein